MTSRPQHLTSHAAAQLTVNAEPYLSCNDCFEQVHAHVDAFLLDSTASTASLPPEFRAHLIGCAACRDEARSLLELAAQDTGADRETVLTQFDQAVAAHQRPNH